MTDAHGHNHRAARAELLTEQQRIYLRLVQNGLTSKEIAKQLGGSHHTVNVQIAAASRVLGARSRTEAAAMLAQAESSYEPSYEPDTIAHQIDRAARTPSVANDPSIGRFALPVPTTGRPTNDLTSRQRVLWILVLAAVVALIVGGLVSGIVAQLDGLGRRV